MSAVRLARAYTNRSLIIKFDGCYHGHGDSFLIKAGSGVATLGIPGSPGVPQEIASLTLSLPYNDLDKVRETFKTLRESGGGGDRGTGGREYGRRLTCARFFGRASGGNPSAINPC